MLWTYIFTIKPESRVKKPALADEWRILINEETNTGMCVWVRNGRVIAYRKPAPQTNKETGERETVFEFAERHRKHSKMAYHDFAFARREGDLYVSTQISDAVLELVGNPQ